ncbi:MAG: AAA family ATPase [Patescibacteria group bacterium]
MEQFFPKPEGLDTTIKKKPKEDPLGVFLERFGDELGVDSAVTGKMDFSYLTPEQRAESMWALFQNVKRSMVQMRARGVQKGLTEDELNELRMGVGAIKNLYEDEEVKKVFVEQHRRHAQEREAINGDLEKFESLKRTISTEEGSLDDYARRIFGKRGNINEMDRMLFKTAKNNLSESRARMDELLGLNAELRVLHQAENIGKYAKELREKGYMWLPSRREFLEQFEEAALFGRPLLVFGESGTGKTELIKNASLKLTGLIANETPGKDTRFESLIAKAKISTNGENYYEYQEIGEAATGMSTTLDEKRSHDGRIVIDDEFNLLPQAEQILRLSRIASWKPGRKIKMPVVNREVEIAPDFLYSASVNLASDKYTGGRSDIPLEVMRKFHKLEVGFIPQTDNDPEIYDGMIAALMDENGRFRASKEEVSPAFEKEKEETRLIQKGGQEIRQNVRKWELKSQEEKDGKTVMAGGFVWRLACTLNELNKSIAHQETVLKRKGEGQYLNKVLIDVGRITEWLQTYVTMEDKISLEQFITEKIRDQFSEMKSFSQEDRELAKDFFAHFSIDLKSDTERPRVNFEVMTPRDIGLLSPRVRYEIVSEESVLAESFYVTPEGKRVEYKIQRFERGGREFIPGELYVRETDGKKYAEKFLGINKENGLPVLAPYRKEMAVSRQENTTMAVAQAQWRNPETQKEQSIEIDVEKVLAEQKKFYKDRLGLEIDEREVRSIWNKHFAEIQSEIEKYGYDEILIVPADLLTLGTLNSVLIETMEETVSGKKKQVAATFQGSNFATGGSFAGVRNSYPSKYRLVLTHSIQSIEDHPLLKATRNKTVMQVTNLDEAEVVRRIANGKDLPVHCTFEINGQEIEVQAEGVSLEEYDLQQRMRFDKTGEHLDTKNNSIARLLKSYSGSLVVHSFWRPAGRRLAVAAAAPGVADDTLGSRLSRSFSN